MKTGVIVVNFGEPETNSPEEVQTFLERIFLANASLEGRQPDDAQRARSRQLAVDRAPGLMATYREIGPSPLNAQARAQAEALEDELVRRGHDACCYPVFQFLDPSPEQGVERALADGCQRLVVLPVYPLCGQSTTVAALDQVARAVRDIGSQVEVLEIAGWHRHPDYLPLHADHVDAFCRERQLDLKDPATRLLFSIHGTPIRYLYAGSRYDRYVDEACSEIAARLGVSRYSMGYQNHTNRPIPWTEPGVEQVIEQLDARTVVVVAPSFMHEQSETLSELDLELRERIEARGMAFHRVPVPFDHPRFVAVLADLVEGRVGVEPAGHAVEWRHCMCRGAPGALCTNGMRVNAVDVAARSRDGAPLSSR